jgi:hypothetical protein
VKELIHTCFENLLEHELLCLLVPVFQSLLLNIVESGAQILKKFRHSKLDFPILGQLVQGFLLLTTMLPRDVNCSSVSMTTAAM